MLAVKRKGYKCLLVIWLSALANTAVAATQPVCELRLGGQLPKIQYELWRKGERKFAFASTAEMVEKTQASLGKSCRTLSLKSLRDCSIKNKGEQFQVWMGDYKIYDAPDPFQAVNTLDFWTKDYYAAVFSLKAKKSRKAFQGFCAAHKFKLRYSCNIGLDLISKEPLYSLRVKDVLYARYPSKKAAGQERRRLQALGVCK